ncbi:MAG TPA: hypothetical protein VGJ60_08145 [Chloroflexota bacterium]
MNGGVDYQKRALTRVLARTAKLPALYVTAVLLALATSMPTYAQSAPAGVSGVWTAGPDANGPDTYFGKIDAPRAGATVQSSAGVLVSGWATDTTAAGWAGFDQMQVYKGDREKGGTKLVDGVVGENRPDIADAFGGSSARSGFSATVPASALASGTDDLYVYMHTPEKGWWYRTVPVSVAAPQDLPYPTDPVVVWSKPCCGEEITQAQFGSTAEYVLAGYALDRNPQTDPNGPPKTNSPYLVGSGNVGIASVTLYMDKLPGDAGYDPSVNLLGGQSGGPASPAVLPALPSDVVAGPNAPPCQFKGAVKYCQGAYSLSGEYGPDYTFAGWVAFWNQRVVQPDMFHTLYAVAKSSITGKSSTAAVQVYVKSYPSDSPPCALVQFLKHQCAILSS